MSLATIMNGRPTRLQADKFIERFKAMKDGETIPHEQVEAIIGVSRSADPHRYRTIMGAAARRILRELGIKLMAERSVGYRRPAGYEQVRCGVANMARGVKQIGRGVKITSLVSDERLPDQKQRDVRDFAASRAMTLYEVAKAERTVLSLTLGKPELLPK